MEAFFLLLVENLYFRSRQLRSFSLLGFTEQECLNQSGSLCFDIFNSIPDISELNLFCSFFYFHSVVSVNHAYQQYKGKQHVIALSMIS